MIPTDDQKLLLRRLHGGLTDEEIEAVNERLLSEDALARELILLAQEQATITRWARATQELPAEQIQPTTIQSKPSESKKLRWQSFAAAAAIALAVAVGVWWMRLPESVARIESAANVEGLSQSAFGRTIRIGGSLKFDAGIVQIATPRNVSVVLEGPCSCKFERTEELLLFSGRAYAVVPHSGRGFSILTPDGKVVDWGTRFGVEVNPGQSTEVHVFEGRVTTEFSSDEHPVTANITAGHAVAWTEQGNTINPIELSHKFVQHANPITEHFDYAHGPLAGNNGWFDSEHFPTPIRVQGGNIQYDGLQTSDGGKLEIGGWQGKLPSPVGRRWHDRYFSMLVYPDDDFPKRLSEEAATLISFGSLIAPTLSDIRLVVHKSDPQDRNAGVYGLMVGDHVRYDTTNKFQGARPNFVVMSLDAERVEVWLDPPPSTLGTKPPPPDLVMERPQPKPPMEALWINASDNPPGVTWYYVDSIRGGRTWADVTPRK